MLTIIGGLAACVLFVALALVSWAWIRAAYDGSLDRDRQTLGGFITIVFLLGCAALTMASLTPHVQQELQQIWVVEVKNERG